MLIPPGCQCEIEKTAFNAYVMRQEQIDYFIEALAAFDDPNDRDNQILAAYRANLDIDSLTDDEIEYIVKEVNNICQN